jgi:hypothetical protein
MLAPLAIRRASRQRRIHLSDVRHHAEREIATVPTILYVDDNPKALRMHSAVFQMCGFRVVTA